MLSYRLGTVNDFHWGFKPVLGYSKPHTFSTSFGEEKEINMHLLTPTRPLRSWTERYESKPIDSKLMIYVQIQKLHIQFVFKIYTNFLTWKQLGPHVRLKLVSIKEQNKLKVDRLLRATKSYTCKQRVYAIVIKLRVSCKASLTVVYISYFKYFYLPLSSV